MSSAMGRICRTATGTSKKRYASRQAAQDALAEHRYDDDDIEAYPCVACGAFHLGHPPLTPQAQLVARTIDVQLGRPPRPLTPDAEALQALHKADRAFAEVRKQHPSGSPEWNRARSLAGNAHRAYTAARAASRAPHEVQITVAPGRKRGAA